MPRRYLSLVCIPGLMVPAFVQYLTHRKTRRLVGYDYASAGWYFVTICTAGRLPLFGEIREGIMGLTDAGCIAHACWEQIPEHVPRAVLDAFVVMPNHVHAIIGLLSHEAAGNAQPQVYPSQAPVATGHAPSSFRSPLDAAPSSFRSPLDAAPSLFRSPLDAAPSPVGTSSSIPTPPSESTLSNAVGAYKSAVTRGVRRTGAPFAWQQRYHDHVIRSDQALQNIRSYIEANPAFWKQDAHFAATENSAT